MAYTSIIQPGQTFLQRWQAIDSKFETSIENIDIDITTSKLKIYKFDGTSVLSTNAIPYPVAGAANGLGKTGTNIVLGGTLTGGTTINTSTFNFLVQNAIAAQRLLINNSFAEIAGALNLRISPPSIDASTAVVGQVLTLQNTNGSVEYEFRNKIKQRNTAINTTLTTSDYMVVTTVNPLTVTLPLAPVDGQNFIIKSILASIPSPVTINGNGKNIDLSPTRKHDINNQSTTLVFNSTLNRWLVI